MLTRQSDLIVYCGCRVDVELPLAVDDEYWEHEDPDRAFQQPSDKPARVLAFICWIKLSQIAAFALRTLVSTR